MTASKAHQQEADEVDVVFYYALTQLGINVVEDALGLWQTVPATSAARNAGRWLDAAVKLVMTRRGVARDLALAYYRLVRALRTGTTVHDPREPKQDTVPLGTLRQEFEDLVNVAAPAAPDEQTYDAADFHDVEAIKVEEIPELEDLMDEDPATEVDAETFLSQLGPKGLLKAVDDLPDDATAQEADAHRSEAHRQAGARQAATASRIARNAGRGFVYDLSQHDGRILGWVRYSRTGTPCGFCAMLLSRAFVGKPKLYRTRKSAGSALDSAGQEVADVDKYHDNCNCVAIPIFDMAQLDSDLFDLNREYARLWPVVTEGLGGKSAMSAWRRFIRQQQQDAPAQEAA